MNSYKNYYNLIKNVKTNYKYIIFGIFVLGLVSIVEKITNFAIPKQDITDIYYWFHFIVFPLKQKQIIFYILSVVAIFISFLIFSFNATNFNMPKLNTKNLIIRIIFYFLFVLGLILIKTKNIYIILFSTIIYILISFFIFKSNKMFIIKEIKYFTNKKLINILTGIFVLILTLQISPFIFRPIKIINEFSTIPEITKFKDSSTIENNEFIKKYDLYNYVKITDNDKKIDYFIKNNNYEIYWQTLDRYFLFHHNHIYGVINELELNKDKDKIFAQYGIWNSQGLRKILKSFGGINLQNYFKVYYSFYILYFLFLFYFVIYVFKNEKDTLIITMTYILSISSIGYNFIHLAPGWNPIRHFFDIPVFFLLYLYLTKKNLLYLILGFILSYIGILNNPLMGSFLYLSVFAAFFIKFLKRFKLNKLNAESAVVLSSLIPFVIFYKISKLGLDYTQEYFLKGLYGFMANSLDFYIIFIVILTIYMFIIKTKEDKLPEKYLLLTISFYIQGVLCYWVWGSDLNHFITYMPIYTLGLFFLIKQLSNKEKIKNIIIVILSIYTISNSINYFKEYHKYEKIFKTHITYKWNLKRAKIISTMNSKYFVDSINLIKKYSHDSNGIYIISKYDSILPFLSEKYSLMPYLNLENYLLSDKELMNSIMVIKNNKPKFIYVDNDINQYKQLVYNPMNYFAYQTYERVIKEKRLFKLKTIFDVVKKDYVPVESSYLITVYGRKK